jgi:glycosyltransferase involved in cell wall biosynthesis
MKILISHPTLNANAKAVVSGFFKQKSLYQLFTAVAVFPDQLLFLLSKIKLFKDFKRRQLSPLWQPFTQSHPFYELGRLLASKLKMERLTAHEKGFFCIDRVYQHHDSWVAKSLANAQKEGLSEVYAYEDGALATFTKAKELGIQCIYDLPIGYWRTARLLLEEERYKRPDWASTLTGFKDSENKLERKDRELALADQIIVASSFTKQTLSNYPGQLAPITVIPYGFPPVLAGRVYENLENRPLKLLFVGGLSQRKGIANLLEAVDQLGDAVTLTIVGHKAAEDCVPLNEALIRHKYIPSLPHEEILKIMREQDVFVFPSLFEGFGLVITEAMSQGTPVITTNRTAGPDLIEDGENGWLVEAGSTTALKQCIEMLLSNPHLVQDAGLAAMKTASLRPWDSYSRELGSFLQKIN